MDAAAKPDMADGAAADVVVVGALPVPRVAVGRTQEHQHLLTLIDRNTAELDGARRRPEEGLHRALIAHRLLERGAGQRGIGAQPGEFFGESREAIDGGANAADRVSTPALSSDRATIGASSSVSSPVSLAAWIAAPKPSGAKASRCICRCSQASTGSASATAAPKNSLRGPKELKTMLP